MRHPEGESNDEAAARTGHAQAAPGPAIASQRHAVAGEDTGRRARPRGATLTVLGIESSCDDTAAAVVRLAHAGGKTRLAHSGEEARLAHSEGTSRSAPATALTRERAGGRIERAGAESRPAQAGIASSPAKHTAWTAEAAHLARTDDSPYFPADGDPTQGTDAQHASLPARPSDPPRLLGRSDPERDSHPGGDGTPAPEPEPSPPRSVDPDAIAFALAPEILSSVVASQDALHAAYGGVVPEIAARAHAERLDLCVERALDEAGVSLAEIDAVAVTAGPGLLGGVLAGVMCAKGIAAGAGLPLIGVNHLAGHALTPRLTDGLAFPYLTLLVSGGHCQLLIVRAWDRFERLGGTIDDAPGEAFDKVARALGLGQPGGPAVEKAAATGDPSRFDLPRPLLGRPGCDLSFSGLKTAVLRARDAALVGGALPEGARADLCAAFQAAVRDALADRTANALDRYLAEAPRAPALAVAGGVAANGAIRGALSELCAARGVAFTAPPLRLCTDNAAMIAWAGIEAFAAGHRDDLSLPGRPRWPLDDRAAPMLGSGRRGAKA